MSSITRIVLVISVCLSQFSFANTAIRLFEIERNTNANYVCYDANLDKNGEIDSTNPISAYWIMAAEDGHREELTSLEKKYAYGFTVSAGPKRTFLFTTKTSGAQQFTLNIQSGQVMALSDFDGREVSLKKMFVQAKGSTFPKVDFVKLTGIDTRSGSEVEKIIRP